MEIVDYAYNSVTSSRTMSRQFLAHCNPNMAAKNEILTDVVVKPEQSTGELCTWVSLTPLVSFIPA